MTTFESQTIIEVCSLCFDIIDNKSTLHSSTIVLKAMLGMYLIIQWVHHFAAFLLIVNCLNWNQNLFRHLKMCTIHMYWRALRTIWKYFNVPDLMVYVKMLCTISIMTQVWTIEWFFYSFFVTSLVLVSATRSAHSLVFNPTVLYIYIIIHAVNSMWVKLIAVSKMSL